MAQINPLDDVVSKQFSYISPHTDLDNGDSNELSSDKFGMALPTRAFGIGSNGLLGLDTT